MGGGGQGEEEEEEEVGGSEEGRWHGCGRVSVDAGREYREGWLSGRRSEGSEERRKEREENLFAIIIT